MSDATQPQTSLPMPAQAATLAESPGRTVLDVRGLTTHLGGQQILGGVDLRITQGEVVALLGTNGSGKSTLVRTLVRAVPASGGSVEVLGAPLGPSVPWKRVGYVPQRVAVTGGVPATVREIVTSGLLGPRTLRKPSGWRERVDRALEAVGMLHRRDEAVAELSGGQQRRVLIARALVREPELLILDEPVAGVDQPSQEAFARTLTQLVARGVTVLVVLHELGELDGLITRTVVLKHGRVVHDGPALRAAQGHDDPAHDHLHPHGDPELAASAVVLTDHPFCEAD
ncbi:metal ABC transporter ATP-binding protein [Sanguibacter sp. A247]|uniref:metal ABC transporter ATP-binding protein n=1 Tax=unclassified Sanguibacter TaxID=2645534 RepID=UPI003FD818D6